MRTDTRVKTYIPTGFTKGTTQGSGSFQTIDEANAYNPVEHEESAAYFESVGVSSTYSPYVEALFGATAADIPQNATINSVTCSARLRKFQNSVTLKARLDKTAPRSDNGTEQGIGTTVAVYNFTYSNATPSDIPDIGLFLWPGGNGSIPSGSSSISYVYGATLSVSYDTTVYSITCSSPSQDITLTPSASEVEEGGSVTYTLRASDLSRVKSITDNGVDITGAFTGSDGVYTYTVTSVAEDHNVVVETDSGVYIKMGGEWRQVKSVRRRSGDGYVTYASPAAFIQEYTYTNKVFFQDFLPYIEPLTFEITQGGTINWGLTYGNGSTAPTGHTIYYSKNGGQWTPLTSTAQGVSVTVAAGDTIKFKGDNPTYYCGDSYSSSSSFYGSTAGFKVKGNIMSLIDSANFTTAKALDTGYTRTFTEFFEGCTGLTDASRLVLPATSLTEYCYSYMFGNCENLAAAPGLPATALARSCYNDMFAGTNITEAPDLPATELAEGCYANMFDACENLVQAPELPATTLAEWCYENMFGNCVSLTTAPDLPATTLVDFCYYWMFQGCTNLNHIKCLATDITASNCTHEWVSGVSSTGVFVENPFATCWEHNENGIPFGWSTMYDGYDNTNLTIFVLCGGTINLSRQGSGPQVGVSYDINRAGTWSNWAKIKDATGLNISVSPGDIIQFGDTEAGNIALASNVSNYITFKNSTAKFNVGGNIMSMIANYDGVNYGSYVTATTIDNSYAFTGLFHGSGVVSADGLWLPATGLSAYCYRSLFSGCTSLTSATFTLPAETMAEYCYQGMFQDCVNLRYTPNLTSLTLADRCYHSMLRNTGIEKAPALPATTLVVGCYINMFLGCANLTEAPLLPAPTLAQSCYNGMFSACTNLNYIKCLATDITATDCTKAWVSGVSSTGTFVKPASMTGWSTGVNGIPEGWLLNHRNIITGSDRFDISILSSGPWTAQTDTANLGLTSATGSPTDNTTTMLAYFDQDVNLVRGQMTLNDTDTQETIDIFAYRLPDDYTPVDHITSTVNSTATTNTGQHINLGIKMFETSPVTYRILGRFRVNANGGTATNNITLINSMNENSPWPGFVLRKPGSSASDKSVRLQGVPADVTIGPTNEILTCDLRCDSVAATTHTVATTLFCSLNGSGKAWRHIAADMWYLVIKTYDRWLCLVPCLNPSGTAGLYDAANNVFYGSEGSLPFEYSAT